MLVNVRIIVHNTLCCCCFLFDLFGIIVQYVYIYCMYEPLSGIGVF